MMGTEILKIDASKAELFTKNKCANLNDPNCSLDLPDEGFNIKKNVEKCSSFTPNPFHDVISQVST